MSQTLEDLSLQFYQVLCNIVGSKDVVKTRRNLFTVMDFTFNDNEHATTISSGSKAEGVDLKGSDYDQMVVYEAFRVFESISDEIYLSKKVPLLMDTNGTKPGFTKLKLFKKSDKILSEVTDWSYTLGQDTYISSQLVKEYFLPPWTQIHGPCACVPGDIFDCAMTYRCNEWIAPAQQWIDRARFNWPSEKLVISVVQDGVLFVPIGCKSSPNEYLEWRMSFSMAEKKLIHSLSHTQLLCYALLKIVLKNIIKPKHGDLICSYFLKTIMFWLCEEFQSSDWKPEKMFLCFMNCLRRLIYSVEYKTCLHYFIPDINLFEERFTGDQHKMLLETLRLLYTSPWTSIFYTPTFQKYRIRSNNLHVFELTTSELSCLWYPTMQIYFATNSAEHAFNYVKRSIIGFKRFKEREVCKYMISLMLKKHIQLRKPQIFVRNNKSFYRQYNITIGSFRICISSDALSNWLLLASFMYQHKRFLECIDIINHCLLQCTPDKIYSFFKKNVEENTVFEKMKKTVGLILTCKHLMYQDVHFFHPFQLLPIELTSYQNHFSPS
ncbi:Hypothetical predicted protein [Mytilus galloprovincialis]|uniref:Mab-21-like HhH/H2TH-like domain-containing protein n=1 Tax=Mytilus galloprovincialis TaxID=29158 RepID=A0A8B6FUY9_MYTGA|nr:Hypothetical predicted protein [Mytilus galloprovincialis]